MNYNSNNYRFLGVNTILRFYFTIFKILFTIFSVTSLILITQSFFPLTLVWSELILKCLQQATTPVNRKEGWFGIRQENLFWQKWYVER